MYYATSATCHIWCFQSTKSSGELASQKSRRIDKCNHEYRLIIQVLHESRVTQHVHVTDHEEHVSRKIKSADHTSRKYASKTRRKWSNRKITNKNGRHTYLFYKDTRKRFRMWGTFFSYPVIRLKFDLFLFHDLASGFFLFLTRRIDNRASRSKIHWNIIRGKIELSCKFYNKEVFRMCASIWFLYSTFLCLSVCTTTTIVCVWEHMLRLLQARDRRHGYFSGVPVHASC